nr:DeoR/GlpR family DNA-binding transcription regulator [Sediminivirga luteola]
MAPERRERILARLAENGTVSVQGLAEELNVTRETIRRDLDQLEETGSVQRVHGGAVPAGSSSRAETSWHERRHRHSAAKQAIAQAALQFVPPAESGSMIVDAGTTTEALADLLAAQALQHGTHGSSRFLLTNAVPIAQKLSDAAAIDVEILGGQVRGLTGAVIGDQALGTLARRRADIAFIGTNGVDATFGLSTPDPAEAAVKSALIRAARRAVLLADSSKLGEASLVQFATLADLSVLITDQAPPPQLQAALDEADVRVIVAEPS